VWTPSARFRTRTIRRVRTPARRVRCAIHQLIERLAYNSAGGAPARACLKGASSMDRHHVLILAVLAFGVGTSNLFAQGRGDGPVIGPPPPNGPRLYSENCLQCHGPEGDAVADVDLGHGQFRRAKTDAEVERIILRGIDNTGMPPHNFTEAEALSVVTYLRSMADRNASTKGNASHGEAIFLGAGNCASCHRVNGKGSRLGPDLSDIGRLRHSNEIEQSIVDPDAQIMPSNRFVRLVTKDGTTITGRLLNHDTFSVQLIDSREQLVSMLTSNLREFTFVDKSSMPSYRGKLSAGDLADLVSYLVSLKGGAQ
jgi:putative heme-binding domain-containing protein